MCPDCAFTSPKEVLYPCGCALCITCRHFLLSPLADRINRKKAGYGLDECNAAREVRKATVPVLMIHGDKDIFVPCWMCDVIYDNYAGAENEADRSGKAGHAEKLL